MARSTPEIPNASMADIAFLLLTFFLVTTTIANDRGLSLILPPPQEAQQEEVKIQERNMFKIAINSTDALAVEGEYMEDISGLKEMIKKFVLNNGTDPASSDTPQKAIVSFKTDRGTTHKRFVQVLDIIQAAYYDIYAERAGITNARWRELSEKLDEEENAKLYDMGRGRNPDGTLEIPMNISIAEPTKVGG